MKVVVDTSVWSVALRRRREREEDRYTNLLRELILEGRVILLGAVRQELLSGIRHKEQFEKLKTKLRAFPDLDLQIEDYEQAANYFNICRKHGIQGSNTDFLICASATLRGYGILTKDDDFEHFSKHIDITLLNAGI